MAPFCLHLLQMHIACAICTKEQNKRIHMEISLLCFRMGCPTLSKGLINDQARPPGNDIDQVDKVLKTSAVNTVHILLCVLSLSPLPSSQLLTRYLAVKIDPSQSSIYTPIYFIERRVINIYSHQISSM